MCFCCSDDRAGGVLLGLYISMATIQKLLDIVAYMPTETQGTC